MRQGIELLFFAYRDFTAEPDAILARYGFGRAHHRVIHFVGRHPQMTVERAARHPAHHQAEPEPGPGPAGAARASSSSSRGAQRPPPAAAGTDDGGRELERAAFGAAARPGRRAPIARPAPQAVEGFRKVMLGIIAGDDDRRRFRRGRLAVASRSPH